MGEPVHIPDTPPAQDAAWRNALAVPFGYRHPDYDAYVLHTTFAYQIQHLADDRAAAWLGPVR
ncbi:hypothetical protein NKH52_04075 [Mesorhizobium sp. M1066]|uniref:hypothetical protein n=1 Tax=unclassified Mesorhizobium TaxID=325217 RepID=UPI003337572E